MISGRLRVCAKSSGQGTVEAACIIPMLFLALLLLLQPGVILYDRTVMEAAAAEGCRLLATKTDARGSMDGSCEAFVRHRLSAIPPHDCFHVHNEGCTWVIEQSGDETAATVSVLIENQVKPLPLLDAACALAGLANERGNLVIRVERSMPVQPDWVEGAPAGRAPSEWPGAWLEEDDGGEG